ncbi:MAG: PhoPQ-activated pathogenicity-related family protein [Bacteroidia bacterium]|nr:PhoPQ-activated pathogenicity-related family protein [Bacteroidia bacterium]
MKYLPLLAAIFLLVACRQTPQPTESPTLNPFESYVRTVSPEFSWEAVDTIPGEGYTTYVIRMVSQRWLTEAEVKDPVWWHWLTIVVPDKATSTTGMLFIGGGSRKRDQPSKPDDLILQVAMLSQTVVADLHNVPNQPVEFVGDPYGPREEDELIAYGWRKFLEGGAKDEDARWLARLPMTTAAVRALDVVEVFSEKTLKHKVDKFVVAGASKRGWTTWTTAVADDRVVAIAPIVIDMLNLVPSFEHHWQVYGQWAPAVGNYTEEGIMEWQGSSEYARLLELTEPFSYRDRLTLPKMIINATGDQFFLPDSWQFYWNDLKGEKHLRYVPNSEHSMRETDALETLVSFYQNIVAETPRPDFEWGVENGELVIQTSPQYIPQAVTLWQAHNPKARNFQVDSIGRAYQPTDIPLAADGKYRLKADSHAAGYTAFFVELTFAGVADIPLKLSTGVVVTPDTYPFGTFAPVTPKGTRPGQK